MSRTWTCTRVSRCTCDVRPPIHSAAIARSISGYAVYLDLMEDGTVFDPACPFHGDHGSMVAVLGSVTLGQEYR